MDFFRRNNGNPFPEMWTLIVDVKGASKDDKECGTTTYDTEELARAAWVGALNSLPAGSFLSAYLYPPEGEGQAIDLLKELASQTAKRR